MRRSDTHIQKEELADLYSSLAYFTKFYDDAEDAVQTVMDAIKDIYVREYGESPDDAVKYLRNRRGAGRKPSIHPEDIATMKRMRAEGISVKDIASEYGISTVHVYSLLRK